MLQNAPSCIIKKKIIEEAYPRTALANAWLRHESQAASRHATCPSPQKVELSLSKTYVRPWTTTKKCI